MTSPRQVAAIGALFGVAGAAGQLWLMRLGALASAPLRAMVSLAIAVLIGVLVGTRVKDGAIKAAVLMGVIAGAILTVVGLAALLMNPELIGQNPLTSTESFLVFVSSLMSGTVVASWLIAGIAALVTWPLSLAQVPEEE